MPQRYIRSQCIPNRYFFLILSGLIFGLPALWVSNAHGSVSEFEPNSTITGTGLHCAALASDGITCIERRVVEIGSNLDPSLANPLPPNDEIVGQFSGTRDYDWFYLDVPDSSRPVTPVYFGCDQKQGYYQETAPGNIFPVNSATITYQVNYYYGTPTGAELQSSYIVSPDSCRIGTGETIGHMRFQMNTQRPGRYYVRIFGRYIDTKEVDDTIKDASGNSLIRKSFYDEIVTPTADYNLKVYTARVSGEQEPNDGSVEAYPLSSGTPATGQLSTMYDQDWFSIHNESSNTLEKIAFYFTCTAQAGTYNLSAYDHLGVLQTNYQVSASQCSRANGFSFTLDTPVLDNYYFAVSAPSYTDTAQFIQDDYTVQAVLDSQAPVVPTSDLSISLDGSPNPVIAGSDLNLTATVKNNGPGTAANVHVLFSLPEGTSFSSGGGCTPSGAQVDCEIGSLGPGHATNRTVVLTPTVAGTASITASLTADISDPNTADNQATLIATVTPSAGLSVALAADPDPVLAGTNLTLRFTASNSGPSAATNVHVKLSLPEGAIFSSGGGCISTGGSVDCAIGNLPAGQGASRAAVVIPTISGSASITASVSANETNLTPANNQDIKVVTVNPAADLSIGLAAAPEPVMAGSKLTLTATVKNNGPNAATNIHTQFSLPEGMTFSSGSGCVASGATVDCAMEGLASGQTTTQIVTVTPTVAGVKSITAAVSADADTTDAKPGNNQTVAVTTVTAADLSVALSADPNPVFVGTNLILKVTVANNGPNTTSDVHVELSLPAGMTFSSGSSCTPSGTAVDCSFGSLAPGQTATRVVFLTPTKAGNAAITAWVSGSETDLNTSNDEAALMVAAIPLVDLSVSLDADPDPVLAGDTLILSVTTSNRGPSTATNIHTHLTLPDGIAFVAGSGCESLSRLVDCGPRDLTTGQTASWFVFVSPTVAGNASITASVSASETDLNTANNQTTLMATIIPAADLSITFAATSDAVVAGSKLTLQAKVTNTGPNTATNAHFQFSLPAGMTLLSGNSCVLTGGSVDCRLGDLTSGQTAIQSLIVTPTLPGSTSIVASVSANETDPITTNNQATVVTTVTPAADLSVTLAATPEPVMAEALLTLKVTVANAGPNPASSVHAAFNLPVGMTFSSGSDCVAMGASVDCSFGDLAPGQTAGRTLVVTPTVAGKTSLMASVSADEADLESDNNQATVAITVTAADVSVALAAAPDPVMAGTDLTLTVMATNHGPYTATNVQFYLVLPTGTNFSTGSGCAAWGGSVICTIGNLASGQTIARIVTVTPTLAGKASIAVSMSADQTDPDPANNQATVATTVTPGPVDLTLSLSTDLNPAIAGNELVYKAVVVNKSFLTNATHVRLALSFPNGGAELLAASPTCAPSNAIVICDLGNIAFYGGTALGFVHVRPTSTGILAASASVGSAEIDSNSADNQFTIATSVLPPIVNPPPPTPTTTGTPAPNSDSPMLVISPNGGELWKVNDKITIHWNLPDHPPNRKVIVSLSKDGGASWKKVKPKVRNTGLLRWKVRKAHMTNRALVRVCLPKGKGVLMPLCDVSDREFTIVR